MNNNQYLSWWNAQKDGKWKTLTASLSQNLVIHTYLNNLLKTCYWRFREKQGKIKGTYQPEIDFQGFRGFENPPEEGRMGHCSSDVKISTQWTTLNGEKVAGSEKNTINQLSQLFLAKNSY